MVGKPIRIMTTHFHTVHRKKTKNDKGKPVERQGRKATGLRQRRCFLPPLR